MRGDVVTPAQIRAGRALLGWSQEELAKEAEVGLSTVRDTEGEKRSADTAAVEAMRRALWNGGVVFDPGRKDRGPGVRLVANWPHIIRRPTTMQKWDGLPFAVEWQGRVITVFVAFDVISDMGQHRGRTSDEDYLKTFERHRGKILDAVTQAIVDPDNFDQYGRLYIRQKDIEALDANQWYKVVIDKTEDIREMEAKGFMNKFASKFISAGIPRNVEVFHDISETNARVYYFSPGAYSIAKDLLEASGAASCEFLPDFSSMRKVRL